MDILVNNAGNMLYKPFVPLPKLESAYPGFDQPVSDEEWDAVIDVHLGGAVRMLRAFGPGMIDRGYGRVVNVVSNVVRRTVPFCTAYDSAKGGLVQLTRSLAREWARYGVTRQRRRGRALPHGNVEGPVRGRARAAADAAQDPGGAHRRA